MFRYPSRLFVFASVLSVALFATLGAIEAAQRTYGSTDPAQSQHQLSWKFEEGQTIYYELEINSQTKEHAEQSIRESSALQRFLYRWDVVVKNDEFAAIQVSFGRIRWEVDTPEGRWSLDSYAPEDPRKLTAEQKRIEDTINKMLVSKFVFYAVPNGGSALGDELPGASPELRVPDEILMPKAFTTGEILGLPDQPVEVGSEWVVPVAGVKGVSGEGRFRVASLVRRLDKNCWLIEGTTTYEYANELLPPGVTSQRQDPRTAKYYFDTQHGLLVEGEEQTTTKTSYANGTFVEHHLQIKRTLRAPPAQPELHYVTRTIAGNEVQRIAFLFGSPVTVGCDWAQVLACGPGILGKEAETGITQPKNVHWMIGLQLRSHKIATAEVYDVTGEKPEQLVSTNDTRDEKGRLLLQTPSVPLSDESAKWFYDDVVTERIFKIVLTDHSGEQRVLYQLSRIPTWQTRTSTIDIEAAPQGAPPLPDPPAGFTWQECKEAKLWIVRPSDWHFSATLRMDRSIVPSAYVHTYVMTKEEVDEDGNFRAGFTVKYYPDISRQTKPRVSAAQFARRYADALVSQFSIKNPMVFINEDTGHRTFSMQVRSMDSPTRDYLIWSDDECDRVNAFIFECPGEEWKDVKEIGATMMQNHRLFCKH